MLHHGEYKVLSELILEPPHTSPSQVSVQRGNLLQESLEERSLLRRQLVLEPLDEVVSGGLAVAALRLEGDEVANVRQQLEVVLRAVGRIAKEVFRAGVAGALSQWITV